MIKKLRTGLCATAASTLLLSASLSYADDTEIFFGGPTIDEGIRPNVLFILDNSGSMNWRLDSNNTATGSQTSRLQVLKNSFADIMANTNDINVGVMVLNSRSAYGNSRYVYPVEYIDKQLADDVDLVASTPEILQSADDAVQAIYPLGSAVINDPALVMGVIDATHPIPGQAESQLTTTGSFYLKTVTTTRPTTSTEYACRFSPPSRPNGAVCTDNTVQTELNLRRSLGNVGLFHFQGLNIPAGATITSAFIEITPNNSPNNSNRNPYINVQMQNDKNPAALNDNNPLGSRTYQSAANVQVNGWISGNRVAINVTNAIQTLKAATPTTNPIQGVFVRLGNTSINNTSTQDYKFCVQDCSTGNQPKLVINYTADGLVPEQRMGALRFQNVGIPQGATVTGATLNFVPAAANANPVTFEVRAERADDATAFVNGSNLNSRSKTTALTTWTPAEWPNQATPEPIEGPDVTALVQEVVSSTGWCGNNAMAFYLSPTAGSGTRSAHSFDGSGGLQPTLTISYTGGENGCFNSIIDTRITASANDGYQSAAGSVNLGATTLPLTTNQLGARFENLPIGRNAEILSAQVILTPAATVATPSLTHQISFQSSPAASTFSATNNNFSGRTNRTTNATCTIDNNTGWDANQPVTCDISSLNSDLNSIFANSAWQAGGALNMFIRPTATSTLLARSFESNPAQSVRLRLKIRNGGLIRTVRNQVNSLVQSMVAGDGTPIVPTYWDAVRYLRNSVANRPSPINSACQANHIVLLTDGQASGYQDSVISDIESLAGSCSREGAINDEKCARTLAKWILTNDQSSIAGDNFITTHTVGFALDASGTSSPSIKKFLREVATNGGGSFSTAESASELSDAFNRIIQEVLATDTSFVSASAPVNSFERSDNKDELYFSLFRPQEYNRWPGNLKRYRFAQYNADGVYSPHIADANNLPAVDPLTGQFADGARSFWSNTADGNNTAAGGAASALPAAGSRKVLTYVGNAPTSNTVLQQLASANTAITTDLLGASTATERGELIDYIRGLDPATSNQRKALGDPIHSSPRLATYSCHTVTNNVCTEADQTAFIGTNEGFLHAFNTSTGVEQFAFMPQELLGNIKLLKENNKTSSIAPRRYGLDNPVVLWTNDASGDGKILNNPGDTTAQTGEFVYAYVTMGRGGRNVYALDVTNRASPKLMWYIKGGETAGFERLGQTWSAPVKTRIKIGNDTTPTDVLIFSGGYDPKQDDVKARREDEMGNAVYIVNAKTGALIWSAGNNAGHTLNLAKMKYSMPGNVRVIDLNVGTNGQLEVDKEQLADQFFIGDMGGQVWRFFINNSKSGALVTAGGTSGDGIFARAVPTDTEYATLDAAGKLKNLRRFYNEPDAALLNHDGRLTLSVNIGSGHRGHPLEVGTEDIFYSFRTNFLGSGGEGTITTADMFDTTTRLFSDITDQTSSDAVKAKLNPDAQVGKGGWYIKMVNNGEKILTRSLTTGQDSVIFFNTYTPGSATASNSCKAVFGTSRGYAVDLFDAAPYTKWYQGTPSVDARTENLKTSGIPPQPEQICIGNTCSVILSPDTIEEVDMPAQGKMYWIDEAEMN
ncbi:PilC/PilY family type IV pilus protein [Pseudomonas sp. 5P_3.1_Bac2]|uniref:PilC/PilY family type IV pilus protein n=1 Tax=Pseudomonas sp. 5P_3.1_Bac2 TaxID=2971617 RepID=UPI0021C89931|nr:PilC/PilY family type IV pilus protein [Pseudomonas sp. 5P_3.1_Bac2]MCU1718156.1 PilC/PilY family type IV pilus protein [Pseudomonas sp. 5P_3.1_Bac2]